MKSIYTNNLKGYVKVWNEAGQAVESSNLVVYNGGDIITQCMSGNLAYKIANMYFVYENTAGTPTPMTPVRTNTAALFAALVAPRDFVRAAVLSPIITASDVNHVGNQATYMAIANAATGVHGVSFSAGSNSKVFTLCIVASPTGSYTGDVLYAQFSLATALPVVGAGQVSASWMLEAN